MRISELFIDGFGIFSHTWIKDIPPGLILFQGNNEAGKSTLLAFIRTILFGFPDARKREPSYPPLRGGQSGGRLTITCAQGQDFTIERRAGKKGGPVKVTLSDGSEGSAQDITRVMAGASPELFKQVYAFSLSELQSIETLESDAVKDALYGAGSGTALLALPRALSFLEKSESELFKPSGKKPFINSTLRKLEETRSQLHSAQSSINLYDDTVSKLQKTEKEIVHLRNDLVETARNKAQIDTYLRLWQNWLNLKECEESLDELTPKVEDFPEGSVVHYENLLATRQEKQVQNENILTEINQLNSESQGLTINKDLLENSDHIVSLFQSQKHYSVLCESIPQLKQKLFECDNAIETRLVSLGKDWTVDKVLSFDRSLFTKEAITQFQKNMQEHIRIRHNAETLLKAKQDEYEDILRQIKVDRDTLIHDDTQNNQVNDDLINVLLSGHDHFVMTAQELPFMRKQLRDSEAELLQMVKDIDPDWSITNIKECDTSVAQRQKVRYHEMLLKAAHEENLKAQFVHETSQKNLKKIISRHKDILNELEKFPENLSEDTINQRKSAFSRLKNLLNHHQTIITTINSQKEQISEKRQYVKTLVNDSHSTFDTTRWVLLSFSGIIIIIGVVLFFYQGFHEGRVWGSIMIFLSLVFFLLFGLLSKSIKERRETEKQNKKEFDDRIAAFEERLQKLNSQKSQIEEDLTNFSKHFGQYSTFTFSELEKIETILQETLLLYDRKSRIMKENEKLKSERETLEQETHHTLIRIQESEKNIKRRHDEWTNYLRELKLKEDTDTETVNLIFTHIETARSHLKHLKEMKARLVHKEKIVADYLKLMSTIPALSSSTEQPSEEQITALDNFLITWKKDKERQNHRELARERFKEKEERKTQLHESLKKAQENLNKALIAEKEFERKWHEWLTNQGLNHDLSPETAHEALRQIENTVMLLKEKTSLFATIKKQEQDLSDFTESAFNLFKALSLPVPDKDKLLAKIDELDHELQNSKKNQLKQEELNNQREKLTRQHALITKQVKVLDEKIASLLSEAGADNEESLRTRSDSYERRKKLLSEIENSEKNLRIISGQSDSDKLKSELKKLTKAHLIEEFEKYESLHSEIEKRLNHMINQRAELKHKIDSLASSEDISLLRAEEEGLIEEIREAAERWSTYKLAEYLLQEARSRFEREQQPAVIKKASTFFKTITGGHYERIIAPVGERTIKVVTQDGQNRAAENLSRGTAEQLYLALRFGFITKAASTGQPLPIIMDDILVNFDPHRAGHSAQAINELSQTHQVLFFTCHPETVEIFKSHNSSVPLYRIEDGGVKLM